MKPSPRSLPPSRRAGVPGGAVAGLSPKLASQTGLADHRSERLGDEADFLIAYFKGGNVTGSTMV